MLQAWLQWWDHSTDIATGSPQVMAKRLQLMSTQPWLPTTWFETQQMVLEKWMAAAESWQAMLWSAWPQGADRPATSSSSPSLTWSPSGVLSDASAWPGHPAHTARVVTQAMAPYSRRVNENTQRLKQR